MKQDFLGTWTFDLAAPVILPATAKGRSVHLYAYALDEDGVSSNILDFSILLR